ncbi:MAG TPA: hypothetical protein DIT25_03120 [Candidatus Moranbacteria bacterium]|nr:hypothetical protein [Candidatus Moranbacteria bacterium]
MDKLKRTIFFWTLVALFIIVAPAIVLNATGYRFDFDRGVFVHSGTITLKANPDNFSVIIDGEMESPAKIDRMNSSYNLTGLIPRQYHISLSAPGFQKWEKSATIHSGLSTEFWNILLVRNNYEKTPYRTGGAEKFFVSPKSSQIILTRTDTSGTGVQILNIKNKTIEKNFHFAGWRLADDERRENIEWSPQEDRLSVPLQRSIPVFTTSKLDKNASKVEMETEYSYFIINPVSKESFNLNEFLGKKEIKNVRWDPKDKNYLFFMHQDDLLRAHISNREDIARIASDVSCFDISKSNVYWAQRPNEMVFKANLDGSSKTQITYDFPAEIAEPNERLIVYDDSRIAFLNTNKDLFIYNKGEAGSYFKKIASGGEGIQFSDDGKKLLFWTNNELSVYFLRKWTVQPERNEDDIQNITRYSEQLKNVQWHKDYEHVIFSVGPDIKIIELDARDRRITMDILKTEISTPFITYVHNLERVFFTDKKETGSGSDIHSIIFPESTSILGIR